MIELCKQGVSILDGNCMIAWTIVYFLCSAVFLSLYQIIKWAFKIEIKSKLQYSKGEKE